MIAKIEVRCAQPQEIDALATTLALAFQNDPISTWIFPDARVRAERHPSFFRIPVQTALEAGEVYTTPDYDGVAVWFPIVVTKPSDPVDHPAAFKEACGPCYERFCTLDELMVGRHPTSLDHIYLAFVGVLPERTRRGVGSALLADRLRRCDEQEVAVYLENSNPAHNEQLYRRFGFFRSGPAIQLPASGFATNANRPSDQSPIGSGPQMCPMWRSPRPLPRSDR